jgi:hypothetical protein
VNGTSLFVDGGSHSTKVGRDYRPREPDPVP